MKTNIMRGSVAGLLGALAMVLAIHLLRMAIGLATTTEMIFDRTFPLLTVPFFLKSLELAGGYTQLKIDGSMAALGGHLLVGILLGLVYASLAKRKKPDGRPDGLLAWCAILGIFWIGTMVALWPVLDENYIGLSRGITLPVNLIAYLAIYALYGWTVHFTYLYSFNNKVDAPPFAPEETAGINRRVLVLAGAGTVLSLGVLGTLRHFLRKGTFSYDGHEYRGPDVKKITPNNEFYSVTKNLIDPDVAREQWRLEIGGLVTHPRSFRFEELLAMTAVVQETTLVCISYSVGSGLCSNAVWKGVPLHQLLEPLGIHGQPHTLLFRSADGYYETFPYAKAIEATTMVAYEMNGEPLPTRHGFPLRLIVPGLYGEKNAKWLTRLEILAEDDPRLKRPHGYGFYKEQGWGPNFTVPIHSRIDAPSVKGEAFEQPFKVGSRVELRGVAFSGDQGISRVEVSTSGGKHWHTAKIIQEGTRISWSLWSYEWRPDQADDYKLIVRAFDAEGRSQITATRGSSPQGSTGLHSVNARVIS